MDHRTEDTTHGTGRRFEDVANTGTSDDSSRGREAIEERGGKAEDMIAMLAERMRASDARR